MERITEATAPRLAPYARVRDADLAAWPDTPNGLFMAESRAVIAAAVESGCRPRSVLLPESFADEATAHASQAPILHVSDELFTQVTGYKIIRGPVAAFERPALPDPSALLQNAHRVAVLEDVGNFANIGSAFRAAHAFGVDAVLVGETLMRQPDRRAALDALRSEL